MVWASWEGFMAWWAKQDFICFESSNRRNFATQYLSYNKKKLNIYQSWKIGSEEKDSGAKHWRRIAQNKHHFPEIEIFIDKDTEDNDKGISLSTRATTCQIVHRHQHSKELQCKMQGGSLRQTSLPADPSVWHMMYQISYLAGLENQISPVTRWEKQGQNLGLCVRAEPNLCSSDKIHCPCRGGTSPLTKYAK